MIFILINKMKNIDKSFVSVCVLIISVIFFIIFVNVGKTDSV